MLGRKMGAIRHSILSRSDMGWNNEEVPVSYEGYVQVLCEKGHHHTFDAYSDVVQNSIDWMMYNGYGSDATREPWACFCGKEMVWVNQVDETNCESAGYVELEVRTEAKLCSCKDCGNKHVKEQVTYKIPEGRGRNPRTR